MAKRLIVSAAALAAAGLAISAVVVVIRPALTLRTETQELSRELRGVENRLDELGRGFRGLEGRLDDLGSQVDQLRLREACRLVVQVREALARRARGPEEYRQARELLAEKLEAAEALARGAAADTLAASVERLAGHLDTFLVADFAVARASARTTRDDEITVAAQDLVSVRAACQSVQVPFEWELPEVGPGRAYPVTVPDARVVDMLTCSWWGSELTLGRRMCVFDGNGRGTYTLTGRVIDDDSWRPIADAKITYYVEGIADPIITWSNHWGDFAFVDIAMTPRRYSCAWRVTTARGYGRQIGIESLSGQAFQTLIFLMRQPEVLYLGDIHPPATCRRWVPPALRAEWPKPPDLG